MVPRRTTLIALTSSPILLLVTAFVVSDADTSSNAATAATTTLVYIGAGVSGPTGRDGQPLSYRQKQPPPIYSSGLKKDQGVAPSRSTLWSACAVHVGTPSTSRGKDAVYLCRRPGRRPI